MAYIQFKANWWLTYSWELVAVRVRRIGGFSVQVLAHLRINGSMKAAKNYGGSGHRFESGTSHSSSEVRPDFVLYR